MGGVSLARLISPSSFTLGVSHDRCSFLHSFALFARSGNSSPYFSVASALFAENAGVYPGDSHSGTRARRFSSPASCLKIHLELTTYDLPLCSPALTLPLRNGMMVWFAYSRCAVRGCDSGPGKRNRPSQRRAVCPHPSLATDGASEVASDTASEYRIGMAPRLPAARGSREGCS